MEIGLITSSYKNCAVDLRERLAVPESEIAPLINYIKTQAPVQGVMILSTCNRVEVYFEAEVANKHTAAVEKAFLDYLKVEEAPVKYFDSIVGEAAIMHIFRVTSSLESMVLGEPQITGQMKNFFHLSVEAGGPGFLINQVLNKAFTTAKRVRNETDIARYAVSISFAATELAKKIFDDLNEKTILIIGAGEMSELAASHLMKAGCSHLMVTNRTFSRAVSLAEKFNGSAVRFESLEKSLESADIIISSTGAKGFILEKPMISAAMKKRRHKSMFFIDIAVPRDISPAINDISDAYVYDIDDLQSVVDANLEERKKEATKAQVLIEEELTKIGQWLATLEVVPTLTHFRESILDLGQAELEKGLTQMGALTQKQERALRSMMNSFAYKVLHQPTVILKQKAKEGGEGLDYVQALIELFDLSPEQAKKENNVIPIRKTK